MRINIKIHFKNLIIFYFCKEFVSFSTKFSIDEAKTQLTNTINDTNNRLIGEIRKKSDKVILGKRYAPSAKGGCPVTPVFIGSFSNKDSETVLSGYFQMEPFVQWWLIAVAIILSMVLITRSIDGIVSGYATIRIFFESIQLIGIASIFLILVPEIGYWISGNDSKFIAKEIRKIFRENGA